VSTLPLQAMRRPPRDLPCSGRSRPRVGHQVGDRSPQAPRLRRQGGRSPQPPRARTGRAQGPLARGRGLAVQHRRPGRSPPLRRRPAQGPRHARDRRGGDAQHRRQPHAPVGLGLPLASAWAFSVRCCPRSARISPSSSSTPEGAGPDVDMRHPVRSVVEAGAARSFGWAWRFGRAASPYGPLDDSGGGEHRPPATLPG
jgi:hypothetical protein